MCGICGFVSKKNISMSELKEMNDTMYHRGPNDSGEEIFQYSGDTMIGLAQRRLSIIDLSSLGHQPMHSVDDRIVLVYNGEIYNFMELRKELSGYPFRSNTDTEVIIAAYLKWGIECVKKFNGMFAIALYDKDIDTVYLIRDRIGKKPLYYTNENEIFAFASELKPLFKCRHIKKTLNKEAVSQYLFQRYIISPQSIYEGIYKVKPGEIVIFNKGNISKKQYWDLQRIYLNNKNINIGYDDAKSRLKELLRRSVEYRMIADVPVGCFLSGGYDSSLIAAVASELSSKPLKTFTIGFDDKKYNEAQYARQIADYLGTDHTELYITEQDLFDMIDSMSCYYDEPFADSSLIPTMLVSQLASKDVTVVLSGDGGDEFFCGYERYDMVHQAQLLEPFGAVLYPVFKIPGIHQLYGKLPISAKGIISNRNIHYKAQPEGGNYIDIARNMTDMKDAECKLRDECVEEKNWQIRKMLLDMQNYLPEDILCKVDRASMKYSLEARNPILDKDIMEFALSLPHKFKYYKKSKKYILKDLAYSYIPKELLDRPKRGFGVPIDKWLRTNLREELLDMSSVSFLKNQGVFNPEYTHALINEFLQNGDKGKLTGKNYSRIVWPFFCFQKWYGVYQ